jgi:hypothetical protein
MNRSSLALVLFAVQLGAVACSGNNGSKTDATRAGPDGSSVAADAANAPKPDATPDIAPIPPTDAPAVMPDAPTDNRPVAADSGPVPTPDAPADNRPLAADTGPAAVPDAAADIRPVAGDAPLGTPDAPVDNRALAVDTGLATTPDAPADNRPVAVDTGLVASIDGGAETSGPQPRVMVIDPATDQFLTYDRDGQPLHDYHGALDFGDGYDRRSVWAESLFVAWDTATATDLTYEPALKSAPLGLDEPLRSSRIVVRAGSTQGLQTRAKLITADGSIAADLTLPGDRTDVRVSPGQKFLYADNHNGGTGFCNSYRGRQALVARIADGATVWQGSLCSAAFARDDSHLVFSPDTCANPVHVVDLASGQDTPASSLFACAEGVQSPRLRGATTVGAVFSGSGNNPATSFDDHLWFVDWQAKTSPFDPAIPTSTITMQYLSRFNPQGSKALWYGSTQNNEFDFANLTSQPWNGADPTCFGRPGNAFVKVEGQSLEYCRCSDGTCALLATLPTLADMGWVPAAQISPDGRFVFVSYGWRFDRMPFASADMLLFSASGGLLLTIPARDTAQIAFDQTGQLAVLSSWPWPSGPGEIAIINLSTLKVTSLPLPRGYGIVYE